MILLFLKVFFVNWSMFTSVMYTTVIVSPYRRLLLEFLIKYHYQYQYYHRVSLTSYFVVAKGKVWIPILSYLSAELVQYQAFILKLSFF